jgi:hypothetical protein
MLSHRVGCDGTLPPCRQGRPSLSSRRDPDSNREAESKRPRRSRPLGSPIPSRGTLSRRRFESSVLCTQDTARRSLDNRLRETAEYSAAGHRTIQLITTAQPRQICRGCVSYSGGVLRVDPGNTTLDQEVAGPAGPVTAGPIRMIGLADCAFLDGYPHVATLRIHADAGVRLRSTAVIGPHTPWLTPRRRTIAPAGIVPATSGAPSSRSYCFGMRTCGFQNARRVRSRSSVPVGTNGDRTVASPTRYVRSPLGSGLPDESRRQSRVPQPRTGSPCGGQVMRGSVSGTRRIASYSRDRHRPSPSGYRPDAPCAGRGGTRRTCPRLSKDEHVAV